MLSMSHWNGRQIHVFQRFGRLHGVALTPEVLVLLAQRFAQKHAHLRPLPAMAALPAEPRFPVRPFVPTPPLSVAARSTSAVPPLSLGSGREGHACSSAFGVAVLVTTRQ